jgi:hypothetical protein
MMRIVDVGRAMGGLPAGEGIVTLKVMDPYAPWNEGFWRFCGEDGRLVAEQVPEPEGRNLPVLSVGALTQWAFGFADGGELQRQGALLSDICVEAMDGLLPRQPVFLYEMY